MQMVGSGLQLHYIYKACFRHVIGVNDGLQQFSDCCWRDLRTEQVQATHICRQYLLQVPGILFLGAQIASFDIW
jgi:hypothetical protein